MSFHADFNAFSMAPIFASDGLPTTTDLGPESFDQSTVTLLPAAGVVSSSSLTSLTLAPAPEPSTAALGVVSLLTVLAVARRSPRLLAHPRREIRARAHSRTIRRSFRGFQYRSSNSVSGCQQTRRFVFPS